MICIQQVVGGNSEYDSNRVFCSPDQGRSLGDEQLELGKRKTLACLWGWTAMSKNLVKFRVYYFKTHKSPASLTPPELFHSPPGVSGPGSQRLASSGAAGGRGRGQ